MAYGVMFCAMSGMFLALSTLYVLRRQAAICRVLP